MAQVTAVVVTGSAPLDAAACASLPGDAVVIAADGGLDHALAAGLSPAVLVGDLDSVSVDGLAWARQHAVVDGHSPEKAATDTELALAHAASLHPQRVVLLAGNGDRLDHAMAAVGALGAPALADVADVEAWWGRDRLLIARPGHPVTIDRTAGTTFSVLALHGPCRGVNVSGARWPLHAADLGPLVGEGVSNEIVESPVRVGVDHGVLTVIIPGAQP